ncbi:hypothetical protein BRAS3809_6840002 [Bradyrhizobium sp. STM 3809]|nr:hypothetical protein BRAS3809_6840002 [Bradyrhizobium sp. STM 3809]
MMRRRSRRRGAGALRLPLRRLTMRRLLRSTVGTDLTSRPSGTLRDDERRGLRVGCGVRQLHRRQCGRRKQQNAKFAHVFWCPETFFLKHGVINVYALGWNVAQFKSATGFISTRSSRGAAAVHVSFSLEFQRLAGTRRGESRRVAGPLTCIMIKVQSRSIHDQT